VAIGLRASLANGTRLYPSRESPMNKLYVGFSKTVELPKGGFLFINDEVPEVPSWRRPRLFDPHTDCFNPLEDLDYKKGAGDRGGPVHDFTTGREHADRAKRQAGAPESPLEGRAIRRGAGRRGSGRDDRRYLGVAHPQRVLCSPSNFTFNPNSVNLVKLDRAELGQFDALVLGLVLMAHFKGQIVVPDFGFCGRDVHVGLTRETRLIAGVNTQEELSPKLRESVLLMKEKKGARATFEDAETLAT
jgi:hypothetical protein